MIKLKSLLNEAKLKFEVNPSISKEDAQTAYKLLQQYFKERGSLHWVYAHDWFLDEVRAGFGWIDGDRYDFQYYPKGGKETEIEPYPGAERTKKYKIFRTPKEAIDYVVASTKDYGDVVFRGMSMAELIDAKKSGFIKSKGEYNLGQVPYTYFGNTWGTGYSYASSFAPFDKEPTRKMPGVIIAVPKHLTKNAKEIGQNTDSEYVAEQIPINEIRGLWIITPIHSGRGYFQLVMKNGKLSDGSRSGPSVRYAIVPKM